MSLGSALTSAILPVLTVAAVGYVLGTVRDIDVDALSTVTIYVLSPALVFYSLATTSMGGDVALKLVAGVVAFTGGMVVLAEGVGRLAGESEPALGALVLSSSFPNAGNYGIPLSAFAFGAIGRSTAVIFIAGQTIMMYTLGVYIASRGRGSNLAAAKTVFKLPLVYAVLAAGVVRALDAVPPTETALMETIRLTGDAAIPVMLLLLGIQLANTSYGTALTRVGTANVLKMAVAPVVALGIVVLFDFGDLAVARVFILECAMPAAITPLILSIQFTDEPTGGGVSAPEYIGTAIFTSTLVSIPTLTVLIAVLQSGAVV